jgi:hypothetical protein
VVLSLWGPKTDGVRLYEARVERPRRIRTDGGYFGGFDLWVPNLGAFRECRLVQYRRGGFFTTGEHRVNLTGRRYVKYFDFEEPFSRWLALQARVEVLDRVYERDGDLLTESDELLQLDEYERAERCDPVPGTPDDAIVIELARRAPHEPRPMFHALIGGTIRVRNLRVSGPPDRAHLVAPASDGLQERPVQLESWLSAEIVRRYFAFGRTPEPSAASA